MDNRLPEELIKYVKSYLINDKCSCCKKTLYRTKSESPYPLVCNYICYLKLCLCIIDCYINTFIMLFFIIEFYFKPYEDHRL